MCTDGLSNYLLDEESIVGFLNETDSGLIVDALVDFANSQGGRDNITAIVIRMTGLDDAEAKEPNDRPPDRSGSAALNIRMSHELRSLTVDDSADLYQIAASLDDYFSICLESQVVVHPEFA